MTRYSCKNVVLWTFAVLTLVQGPICYAVVTADEIRHDRRHNQNCFQAHLLEAIHTNTERKQLYANLTDGKSKKLPGNFSWPNVWGLSWPIILICVPAPFK